MCAWARSTADRPVARADILVDTENFRTASRPNGFQMVVRSQQLVAGLYRYICSSIFMTKRDWQKLIRLILLRLFLVLISVMVGLLWIVVIFYPQAPKDERVVNLIAVVYGYLLLPSLLVIFILAEALLLFKVLQLIKKFYLGIKSLVLASGSLILMAIISFNERTANDLLFAVSFALMYSFTIGLYFRLLLRYCYLGTDTKSILKLTTTM
jgi:hypothetical protein